MFWLPGDPAKPPHWRWDVGMEAAEAGARIPPRYAGDTWVSEAVAYAKKLKAIEVKLKAEAEASKPAERGESMASKVYTASAESVKFSDIASAYRIYGESSVDRWLLEAELLSGMPLEESAAYHGYSFRVIETYSRVFYDVADKLTSPVRVWNDLLAPLARRLGNFFPDVDLFLKQVAYDFGVEATMSFMTMRPPSAEVSKQIEAGSAGVLAKKELLALASANAAGADRDLVLRHASDTRKAASDAARARDDSEGIHAALNVLQGVVRGSVHAGMRDPGEGSLALRADEELKRLHDGRISANRVSGTAALESGEVLAPEPVVRKPSPAEVAVAKIKAAAKERKK